MLRESFRDKIRQRVTRFVFFPSQHRVREKTQKKKLYKASKRKANKRIKRKKIFLFARRRVGNQEMKISRVTFLTHRFNVRLSKHERVCLFA